MHNFLALLTLLSSCYVLLCILKPTGLSESILFFFCLFTAHIVVLGYALSFISRVNDIRYWSTTGMVFVSISAIIYWRQSDRQSIISLSKFGFQSLIRKIAYARDWYKKELSGFEKLVLSLLTLTVLLIGALNLIVVIFTAPHNWDSMAYHLARVAYYLQNHNLNYYNADYWAQVIHPKNSSLLLLYTYLISGGNENITQMVQFISYWVAICSVYAISSKVGNNKTQSIFAAMVSALLTEWLMLATTTQNDLVLVAYFGAIVYFLFAFGKTSKWKYLVMAALGIGLTIGTKESSLLALPSVGLLALYNLFRSRISFQKKALNFSILVICTLLAVCIFALPAGYIENYHAFRNPLGPKVIRIMHSFEDKSTNYILRNGTKNLIRFGFEFISLDGMPPIKIVNKAQALIRILPIMFIHKMGIDLDEPEATRIPFDIQKPPTAHEDFSYWGVLGFGFIWPVVFLSVFGVIKTIDSRLLSVATVFFIFTQAYTGPYDPWRGRYFAIAAIFAAPVVGVYLQSHNRFLRVYVLFIVITSCASAILAVTFRSNSSLVSIDYQGEHRTSIFAMNRMEQLTRNKSYYYETLKNFDELVPKNAIVAIFLLPDSYEYPLFGEHLTRTIIPINPFKKRLQPIPVNAEYLLYADGFPCPDQKDIFLGTNWHLRRLTDNNRKCP